MEKTPMSETLFRKFTLLNSTLLLAACLVLTSSPALAQAGSQPDGCRSAWGPDDQRGAANRLTPAKVKEAASLIRTGKVYSLGRLYEQGMPLFGTRSFTIVTPSMVREPGENRMTWNEEIVTAQIGQVGTQFDGLGHVGIGDTYYNCFDAKEFVGREGLKRLGVEHVGPIFTRGVLIDVAAYKGVVRLEKGYEITPADLEGALERQGVAIHAGDVVILHTGWGSLWNIDNEAYNSGAPGIGLKAGQWLVDQKIVMVGGDTWPTEVVPNPNPNLAFPVHQLLLVRNGIYILENLDTSDLARDKVYEFAFLFSPVPIKGASGSPGNPIAVR
ncbi:MAG: cyclase family protein [Acidobacteria bacterium]|nr:cyclase family protein [Acidobacteriota bacterium]